MTGLCIEPGRLIAVVGPSGSGKDTLLRAARAHFADDPNIVFPRRTITRPAGDLNEDHLAMTPEEFERLRNEDRFALHWEAHGLCYGIPASIDEDIAAGRTVVANLSRSVVAVARNRFANCVSVAITIDEQTMRDRLTTRGRETTAEIESRIARMDFTSPKGFDHVIDNTGPVEAAIAHFQTIVSSCAVES